MRHTQAALRAIALLPSGPVHSSIEDGVRKCTPAIFHFVALFALNVGKEYPDRHTKAIDRGIHMSETFNITEKNFQLHIQ